MNRVQKSRLQTAAYVDPTEMTKNNLILNSTPENRL